MAETSTADRRSIEIPIAGDHLLGDLALPRAAKGLVVFAHGSGSGRHSPRNRAVADALHASGNATLLLDLLTPREAAEDERSLQYRFQIPLLGERLVAAVDWAASEPTLRPLRVGLYGASTGGAAALLAAAARPHRIGAIVLRGARADLAAEAIPFVRAPTLHIVGGRDPAILEIAKATAPLFRVAHSTTVVPGATHLFEEAGALEAVTIAATAWFGSHLSPRGAATGETEPGPGRGA